MGDSKTMEALSLATVHRQCQQSNMYGSFSPATKTEVSAFSTFEPYTYSNYIGANILGKREISKYSQETKTKLAAMVEELFQLKIKRLILLRKESELDYQVHDLILQEEYKQRSKAMMALANRKCLSSYNTQQAHNTNSAEINNDEVIENEEIDDITQMKEARLFDQMISITSKRNQLLVDLDIERLREEEEELEILEEHKQLQIALQNLRESQLSTMSSTVSGHCQSPQKETKDNKGNREKRERRVFKMNSCFLC